MGHLCVKNTDGEWQDRVLDGDRVVVLPEGPVSLIAREQLGCVSGPVLARTRDWRGLEAWVLLCTPKNRTRVNGLPVPIGARVLADRDAISLGAGHTVFFSTECVAEVVPFPGEDAHACCIRCKLPIEPGSPVVRCPGCGLFHHLTSDQPCWTYTEGCAACGHPTDLNAGLQWTPADL